jgi:Glucose-6-phosphate dehydrogenase, NAD binding domain
VTPSPRQSGHNPNIRTGSTHTRTGSTNTDTSNTGSQERSDALVFFGATGDLAHRKIFPALQAMAKHGDLDIPVIGVAKAAWTLDQLRPRARDGVERYGGLDPAAFAHLSRSTSVAAGGQPSSKDSASGELRLFAMSLEIRLVELQLESTYPRIDLDLSAPGHSWQVAGRRAGRARHQAVLSRSESKPHVRGRREERQGRCPIDVRVLVQIDNNCPGRPVDEGADGYGFTAGRIRY